jgi:hypothetical protein
MSTASITDVEVGERTRLVGQDERPLKDLPESTFKEKIVSGLAAVSFAASVTAVIFASTNPVVYVSGILGIAMGPYAAVQQRKITDVDALSKVTDRGQ